jgi:hypothetical protein
LYEPSVLIHVAFKWQSLLVASEHSSMSEMGKISRVFETYKSSALFIRDSAACSLGFYKVLFCIAEVEISDN